MIITRRDFVSLAAGAAAPSPLMRVSLAAAPERPTRLKIKILAFDAFAIFDPSPVFDLAGHMFPGAGLSEEWRTRQFEYCWLRVAANRDADFWRVMEEALIFAANKLTLTLSPAQRSTLMNAYLQLRAWPDVVPALDSMRTTGVRLALLSNFTDNMLKANIRSAGLAGIFEQALSTDLAKTYKPDPRAYQLGQDTLRVKRQELLFVASAGWDAAGATLFGYPTYWVNRQDLPAEELGVRPDGCGASLSDLVRFLHRATTPATRVNAPREPSCTRSSARTWCNRYADIVAAITSARSMAGGSASRFAAMLTSIRNADSTTQRTHRSVEREKTGSCRTTIPVSSFSVCPTRLERSPPRHWRSGRRGLLGHRRPSIRRTRCR
jgi:2-haloacid dehalogenase